MATRPMTPSPLSTRSSSPTSSLRLLPVSSTQNLSLNRAIQAKATIKSKLVIAIKDLQVDHVDVARPKPIENQGEANKLCHALEAMLVHGLKQRSFLGKINHALLGSKQGKRLPEVHFWLFAMIFSHKHTLEDIGHLKQINTDIGRSRAWVRLALNEGLLLSYLQAMAKDKHTCRQHYQNTAFIRDSDCFDVAIKYLLGIEGYKFKLPLNSSLLNRWQTPPLILAGLWIPDNITEEAPAPAEDVVASLGEDVVASLDEEDASRSRPFDIPAMGISSQHSYLHRGLLNEDEALRLILAGTPAKSSSSSSYSDSPREVSHIQRMRSEARLRIVHERTAMGSRGASPEEIRYLVDEDVKHQLDLQKKAEAALKKAQEEQEDPEMSAFESIYNLESQMYQNVEVRDHSTPPINLVDDIIEGFEKYTLSRSQSTSASTTTTQSCPTPSGQIVSESQTISENETTILLKKVVKHVEAVKVAKPRLAGFVESFDAFGGGRHFDTPPQSVDNAFETMGFALKEGVSVAGLSVRSSQFMMGLYDQVARSQGLGEANYQCSSCMKAIGTLFGPARNCGYTKRYYCDECHSNETTLIPAKVVFNWDFTKYKVCHKAKKFLESMVIEPIIDVKTFNASLFEFAPELDEVFILRKRLHYMYGYLATCRFQKIKDKFTNLMRPKKYLYKEVSKYSIQDLELVRSGQMAKLLKNAWQLAENHILKCLLCSAKGFICEVCQSPKPIYPFHLEQISQCNKCFTVFHAECSQRIANCPRCERISARNLNWLVSKSRIDREVSDSDTEDKIAHPETDQGSPASVEAGCEVQVQSEDHSNEPPPGASVTMETEESEP